MSTYAFYGVKKSYDENGFRMITIDISNEEFPTMKEMVDFIVNELEKHKATGVIDGFLTLDRVTKNSIIYKIYPKRFLPKEILDGRLA